MKKKVIFTFLASVLVCFLLLLLLRVVHYDLFYHIRDYNFHILNKDNHIGWVNGLKTISYEESLKICISKLVWDSVFIFILIICISTIIFLIVLFWREKFRFKPKNTNEERKLHTQKKLTKLEQKKTNIEYKIKSLNKKKPF